MSRTPLSKRQVAIFLGIAALACGVVALVVSAQKESFSFEVELRSSQTGTAQLYYDTGRGINEADSKPAFVREGDSTVRFPLPLGEYDSIRFDPLNHGYCYISIREMKIVDMAGHVLRSFSPEDFTTWHNISKKRVAGGEMTLNLTVTDEDPYFTTSLAPPLILRPSMASFWQFTVRTFFFCFLPLSAAGICWLLFAPRHWTANALLFSLLTGFVYLFARSRFLAPINWDEEFYIWYGSLINNGSVPYRDFVEVHPPVILFANALGLAVFGLKDFLFRIVPTGLGVLSIALFCVAMIRRRIVPWLAVLLTAQVALWLLGSDFHDTGLNDSESYGFAFVILGFSLGSLATGSRNAALQVLSGICLALAVLSKEFFVFVAIPAWLMVARHREDKRWDKRQLLFSAAGGIAAGSAFLAYLVAHSALGRYLDTLRLARTFAANYAVDIGRFPNVSGLEVLLPSWTRLHDQLYNFDHLAFVLPLWVTVFVLTLHQFKERSRIADLGTALVALVGGMVGVSVGFCFWNHYFLMGTAGLLLLSVLGAEAVSEYLSKRGWRASLGIFVLLSALFLFVATSATRVALAEKLSPPDLFWDSFAVETIEKHSKPGDYVLASAGPLILVAMDRKNPYPLASPLDEILPYVGADHPEQTVESLRDQLEKNRPKVCYFAAWLRPRQKRWYELLYKPLLAKYHYVRVNDEVWYLPQGN